MRRVTGWLVVLAFAQSAFAAAPMRTTMDRNNDGVVTRAEATGAVLQAFDQIDTDRNGRLTRAEVAAFAAAPGTLNAQVKSLYDRGLVFLELM